MRTKDGSNNRHGDVRITQTLCDQDSLPQELEFLTTVFKMNGYSTQQIRHAMEPTTPTCKNEDKPTATAYLPYTQTTFGWLSRMLAKHNIKSVALPHHEDSQLLATSQRNTRTENTGHLQHPVWMREGLYRTEQPNYSTSHQRTQQTYKTGTTGQISSSITQHQTGPHY
jgi:hypothetical protein